MSGRHWALFIYMAPAVCQARRGAAGEGLPKELPVLARPGWAETSPERPLKGTGVPGDSYSRWRRLSGVLRSLRSA